MRGDSKTGILITLTELTLGTSQENTKAPQENIQPLNMSSGWGKKQKKEIKNKLKKNIQTSLKVG